MRRYRVGRCDCLRELHEVRIVALAEQTQKRSRPTTVTEVAAESVCVLVTNDTDAVAFYNSVMIKTLDNCVYQSRLPWKV